MVQVRRCANGIAVASVALRTDGAGGAGCAPFFFLLAVTHMPFFFD
jgi:hypothetical protein